jgi:hypothetical protein
MLRLKTPEINRLPSAFERGAPILGNGEWPQIPIEKLRSHQTILSCASDLLIVCSRIALIWNRHCWVVT